MSRIRVVGGSITKTSKGATTIEVLDGNFVSIAAKQNMWNGGENGVTHHEYVAPEKKEEKPKEITFSGWWSPDFAGQKNLDRDSDRARSYLDQTVYFQLNVSKDIPLGTNITFQLWDKDTGFFLDWVNPDDDELDAKKVYRNAVVREVDGKHRMTIELFLNPKWKDDLVKDKGPFKNGCLDLYWTWEYDNTNWTSDTNILNVYPSDTTLHIKAAYEGYGFPEIRSADGELIVFSAGIVAVEEPSKDLEQAIKSIEDDIKGNAIGKIRENMVKYSDKLRYTLAVKQLKKGHLVNNMGKVEFSRRVYTKPVMDNSGEVYTITKAANFGYKKDGQTITTKGISQLDYFREVGVRNAILKNVEKFSYVLEILDVLKFGMEGKMETLITAFPPLDFLNVMVYPSIRKPIERIWDQMIVDSVEDAKDKGLSGIDELADAKWFNRQQFGDYKYIRLNSDMVNKLLNGKYQTFEDLKREEEETKKVMDKYDYNSSLTYTVLYCKKMDNDIDKLITYIETIFIN
ncbi:hypothetical protein B4N84_23405 [Flavobacterium sp. IR1]|nr:hypothetical protein B4N84_23405 [Flavobacterium sp. IR1]